MTNVLSIDGGGVLGCGPATFLHLAESYNVLPKEDVLAGTSVGALLVALRLKGQSWMQVNDTFHKWVHEIFKSPGLLWRLDPTRPKYPSTGLERAVAAELGDLRCCDVATKFFIPAFDFRNMRAKVYDNTDTDLLRDVVLRSTAAPTYFAPRDSRWADGGLCANNPSTIAIAGAVQKLRTPLNDLRVLSLDTGGSQVRPIEVGARLTKIGWASAVIKAALEGSEELDVFKSGALLGSQHLRVIPQLTRKYEIDDLGCMQEYRYAWQRAFFASYADLRIWSPTCPT